MAAHDTDDTYLTVAEVAATLKLNQQTVRNWIDAGTLPAVRVGRRVRIKSSDFDRVIAESYSGSPAAETHARPGQTADGFWGGEPVGRAETSPDQAAGLDQAAGPEQAGRPGAPAPIDGEEPRS